MILCPNCFSECRDDAAQCGQCGEPLIVRQSAPTLPTSEIIQIGQTSEFGQSAATPNVPSIGSAPIHPPWQPPATPPPDPHAPPMDPNALPATTLALCFSDGDKVALRGKHDYAIGRRDVPLGIYPDVDLTERGGIEAGVSRKHAVIHARRDGYLVEDLGSANETLLNFQRLLPNQLYPLNDGDQVRFGLLGVMIIID